MSSETSSPLSAPVGRRAALAALTAPAAAALTTGAAQAAPSHGRHGTVRVMTYNASLNRSEQGQLVRDLSTPDDAQAAAVAEVIQRLDPDILLINEFDHDSAHEAERLFQENYLAVSQNGQPPLRFAHSFSAPVNTGVDSGLDLDHDGRPGTGDDAWGFGLFPGQYGMLVLSRFPMLTDRIRTFQRFRWADMPDSLLPWDWYGRQIGSALRLSSKSHWDIPLQVGAEVVHVLASHPTPPSFDGPEDRNGRRNHDEIRLWADYISAPPRSAYLYDDQGRRGGLEPGSRFVIMGDQNSDPIDGDSWPGSIQLLLDHPRVHDPLPGSEGAVEAARLQPGNEAHGSDPRYDTADFSEPAPGNLRADYVLPSKNLRVTDAGVFWPRIGQPGAELTGARYPFPTSDHRPVWIELSVRGA